MKYRIVLFLISSILFVGCQCSFDRRPPQKDPRKNSNEDKPEVVIKYKDQVKITSGFYKGWEGTVLSVDGWCDGSNSHPKF